jgi:hypothetical protein
MGAIRLLRGDTGSRWRWSGIHDFETITAWALETLRSPFRPNEPGDTREFPHPANAISDPPPALAFA